MGRRAIVAGALLAAAAMAAAGDGGRRYDVRTNPMTCDYCAYDLEQALLRLPSVTGVEIDIDGVIHLQVPTGSPPGVETIRSLMLEHGFDFHGMTEETP